LDNRIEYCHPDDTAQAIVSAVEQFDSVNGRTLIISGGEKQRMFYSDMIRGILGVLGLPLPPAKKFTAEPYYLDWYDTSDAQQLLKFQKRSFTDYLYDFARELSHRYGNLFVPFMQRLVGPIFGRLIVQCM
jgi:nucleoside-diphosphate-sugar epimerase